MPTFNFSNVKSSGSQDYGFLVDQLDIQRNQLEADGKLSPGDYDVLIGKAQKIYASAGLTPAQRSNVLVKISQYKSDKSSNTKKDSNDIGRLNDELKNTSIESGMLLANNPTAFLTAKRDALGQKLVALKDSVDGLESAGDDPSGHLNEYLTTLTDYNDAEQALDDVKNYKPGAGAPVSGYGAYITTNDHGEITNIDISRSGNKAGYAEVKALYGGLPVYGNVKGAKKQNGKVLFQLGNETYSGADVAIPDPLNPGTFKSSTLVSETQKKNTGGGRTIASGADPYVDVDLSTVIPQSFIRDGGWAEGSNGFLYQKLPNGKYKKYTNTKREDLGIQDSNIIRIPRALEQSIIPSVLETVDGAAPLMAPQVPTSTPAVSSSTPAPTPEQQAGGTVRTKAPTERAPNSVGGIAARAYQGAKGLLSKLFD